MQHVIHLSKDKKLATIICEPYHELKMRKNIGLHPDGKYHEPATEYQSRGYYLQRFLALYGSDEPTSKQVLSTPAEKLRSIGLSNAKVNYVHNVAAFCIEHKITDKKLLSMTNEEVIELLTQIKGVGRWTVEMLLMFTLYREDLLLPTTWVCKML